MTIPLDGCWLHERRYLAALGMFQLSTAPGGLGRRMTIYVDRHLRPQPFLNAERVGVVPCTPKGFGGASLWVSRHLERAREIV